MGPRDYMCECRRKAVQRVDEPRLLASDAHVERLHGEDVARLRAPRPLQRVDARRFVRDLSNISQFSKALKFIRALKVNTMDSHSSANKAQTSVWR